MSRAILRNTFSGYLKFIVPFAIGMLMTPYIIRNIGVSNYGLWALVLSTTGYFALLDLGFGQAMVRYVAMNKATGSREDLNHLISTFLVVYSAVAFIIIATTLFLSANFSNFFRIEPDQVDTSRWALLISGIGIGIRFPLNIFGGLLYGYQRYDLAFATEILFYIVNAIATVVLLNSGHGLLALMLSATTTSIAAGTVIAIHAWRVVRPLEINPFKFQWSKIKEISSFSFFFFLETMAVMIALRSDEIVIGVFLPTTAVAIYAIAFKISEIVRNLSGQLNSILFPVAADLHARADNAKLRRVLLDGSRISMTLVAGLGIGVIAIGRAFIEIWVGPEFLPGYPVLVVLIVVVMAIVAQDLPSKVLNVIGKQKLVAAISVADAFINATISIILVQILGILGVALGTLIPFLGVAFFTLAYACRCVGLSLRSFVLAMIFPGFVPGLVAGAVLLLLQTWSYPNNWITLAWQGAIGMIVFGIACLVVGIVRLDRRNILVPVRPSLKMAKSEGE